MSERKYDYVYHIWHAVWHRTLTKRLLRKLVREAALMGHEEIDNLGTLPEQKAQADRIAKELIP